MVGKPAMISSKYRVRQANSMREDKIQDLPFDLDSHFAKVCINRPVRKGRPTEFVIKSRYCQRCTKKSRYYC